MEDRDAWQFELCDLGVSNEVDWQLSRSVYYTVLRRAQTVDLRPLEEAVYDASEEAVYGRVRIGSNGDFRRLSEGL